MTQHAVQIERRLSFHKERRLALIKKIKETHPATSAGLIVLFANFEQDRYRFRQESSFYYLSGIEEPATVLVMDLTGKTILYIPHCGQRDQWVDGALQPTSEHARQLGVDEIRYLGDQCKSYLFSPLFAQAEYRQLINLLHETLQKKQPIFTLNPASQLHYIVQKNTLERLATMVPGLEKSTIDISPLVAQLRRTKSKNELEYMFKAVEITMVAQEGAAQMIAPHKKEYEIAAGIEYIFGESGCNPAFPSIVASGKNGTILHYNRNNHAMKDGDLVVIDIGAEYNYYCADLSRTYPVSGKFTKRQKELYTIV